jgi:hypothetical protein
MQNPMYLREIRKNRVIDWKKSHPCVKCSEDDVDVLDAHHLDPFTKSFSVAHVSAKSIDSIDWELSLCLSLCSNCHRKLNAWLRSNGLDTTKENFDLWLSVYDRETREQERV